MLRNYLITAWRNLMRNKAFSVINIVGLTVGITVCLMIFLFILNEFSVDGFHANSAQIYRVIRHAVTEGKEARISYLSGMHAPALLNDFKGDVVRAVRVGSNDNLFTVGDKSFHETRVADVDPDFFVLFSFPLLKGEAKTVLQNPSSLVMTESSAKKYFGSADLALGKVVMMDKDRPLTVTGIARDVPVNSHLQFDMVVPLAIMKDAGYMTNWVNNGVYTYIQVAPGVRREKIEAGLPAFVQKYLGGDMRKYGFNWSLSLVPLKDVYFDPIVFDQTKHGDKNVVYVFLSIAVLILCIACINFMNLSTIRAVDRSKEVGLRKVLGAQRTNLVAQFIGESLLLTAISCALSVILLFIALPAVNKVLGYPLAVSWTTPPVYLFLGAVILVVGILSGTYPAFFLSAFSPIQAIKGKLRLGKEGSLFRQSLVVVQFSISLFLIVGTIVITKQMQFVKNKQLGYRQDQAMVVRVDNGDFYNHMETFKSSLAQQADISSVSFMSGEPGGFFDGQTFDVEGQTGKWHSRTEYTDFDYVSTLGLRIIAGRDLSGAFPTDTAGAALINRTAAARLGWTPQQALGKWIQNTIRDNNKRRIVGVVEDFNFQSLKQSLDPLVIAPGDDKRVAVIRLNSRNLQTTVDKVAKAYKAAAPAFPFEYRFLDQQFQDLYEKDIRQQAILSVFAILAISVACLGLFGLASFTATKRFKEIGLRKVLGSSVQGIVVLLSKDLLQPVIIATVIALPAAWWAMNHWLQNFAYQTPLSWWVFGLAAVLVFGISILTVGARAVQAALTNPALSLRTE